MISKEENVIIHRSPQLLYFPDTIRPGLFQDLSNKLVRSLLGGKMPPFKDGYEFAHPIETRSNGGVLFLTHKNKIILTSLPKEDFGTDERDEGGDFFPTKTEHIPSEIQMKYEGYFYFDTMSLTEEMFSVVTGGIEEDEVDPGLAITREALEELKISLDHNRINQIDLLPFEVWQSTTRNTAFAGSIRKLFLGNQPVAIDYIQVPIGVSPKSIPFRYGRYKFNVGSFYSYELTNEEVVQLEKEMTSQGRKVKIVDLTQGLNEDLKPSTRQALEQLAKIGS